MTIVASNTSTEILDLLRVQSPRAPLCSKPPEGMGAGQVQSVNERNINKVSNEEPEHWAAAANFGSETRQLIRSKHALKT